MGDSRVKRTRVAPPSEPEACVDLPWWAAAIMPDLNWARKLMHESDCRRARAQAILGTVIALAGPYIRCRRLS